MKFKPGDKIRVVTDFPEDNIKANQTGVVVSPERESGYSVFLDDDVDFGEKSGTKYWPVVLKPEDMELA